MKKLVLLLAVVASATLFSCSGNKAANDSTANTDTTTVEAPTPDTTPAAADTTGAQA